MRKIITIAISILICFVLFGMASQIYALTLPDKGEIVETLPVPSEEGDGITPATIRPDKEPGM